MHISPHDPMHLLVIKRASYMSKHVHTNSCTHAQSIDTYLSAGNSQQEDNLNTERLQLRQQTSLIQLLGISTLSPHPCSTEQDRKQIRVTALQRPALFLSIDLCFRISCTFLSSMHLPHRALALHLLHQASAPFLGFGPAFTASGFGPTFGLLPRIGLRPCIYRIELRPCIYCIGLRPCIYCIGVPTPHRASGLAFTASRF
ncbi:hypothetical protein CDL15_Pgr023457 [Punica granatum]|uniref:Uncharacterized protein n=1 Tax=Punica granatum TaxID=22663 RepID=A0A218XNG2_PUNGR|nr:hypothetical protein CDL15_Pgr023457 [Punica granatum]